MPPSQRKAFANAAYGEFHKVASQLCEMVDEPAADTIIVRIAIVGDGSVAPTLDTLSAMPKEATLLTTTAGTAAAGDIGPFSADASVNLVGTDAITGAVVWQAVDRNADRTALTSSQEVDFQIKAWAAKFGNWMSAMGLCS
ncbi:MAG: DUF3313 domain-containing protein [Rhodospirillales bacterium]|nr:DUF3313 domain-containing protein [Rhodospirillales bacterium]